MLPKMSEIFIKTVVFLCSCLFVFSMTGTVVIFILRFQSNQICDV